MSFQLHSQLQSDCLILGDLPLCQVLLMNNKRLPWYILVPKVANIREIYELNTEQQEQLSIESTHFSELIMREYKGDKLNIAALGNQVPQLHLHHIVRYTHDPAWPNPIWGNLASKPYSKDEHKRLINQQQEIFQQLPIAFTPC